MHPARRRVGVVPPVVEGHVQVALRVDRDPREELVAAELFRHPDSPAACCRSGRVRGCVRRRGGRRLRPVVVHARRTDPRRAAVRRLVEEDVVVRVADRAVAVVGEYDVEVVGERAAALVGHDRVHDRVEAEAAVRRDRTRRALAAGHAVGPAVDAARLVDVVDRVDTARRRERLAAVRRDARRGTGPRPSVSPFRKPTQSSPVVGLTVGCEPWLSAQALPGRPPAAQKPRSRRCTAATTTTGPDRPSSSRKIWAEPLPENSEYVTYNRSMPTTVGVTGRRRVCERREARRRDARGPRAGGDPLLVERRHAAVQHAVVVLDESDRAVARTARVARAAAARTARSAEADRSRRTAATR